MECKAKAYGFLMYFLCLVTLYGWSQDQKVADSLAQIYRADTVRGVARLELLRNLSFNEVNDPGKALTYAEELIRLSGEQGNDLYLSRGYLQKGNKKRLQGKLDEALVAYSRSAAAGRRANYRPVEAGAYGALADVYAVTNDHHTARRYYHKAINLLRAFGDSLTLGALLSNAGDAFLHSRDYDSALVYFKEAEAIFERINYKVGKAYSLGNIAMVYANKGENRQAENYMNEAFGILETEGDHYPIRVYLKSISDIYSARSELLRQQKEKQQVVVLSMSIILALAALILASLSWYSRTIVKEKKISEGLLLNILPAETANELKRNGRVEAVRIDRATVLFTDFVEFSRLAGRTDPEQLVKSIDFYFKSFDAITTKYGLEKIKTIGDSYMCVCGLHNPDLAPVRNVVLAAQEMIELVDRELQAHDGFSHFEVRIGIHTGPVVAGIVGTKKWQYDIWGDTVNIASRMESMSKPGRVNLSETTYQEIKDEFLCEYRGEIEVKNLGPLKMYFLASRNVSAPVAETRETMEA